MGSQSFEQQVIFYHNIFVYCAISALVFLIIAAALFFMLKIPRVFGEMTGRDAKKAIDKMMEENAVSGSLTSIKPGEDGRRCRKGKTGAPMDILDCFGNVQTEIPHVWGMGRMTANAGISKAEGTSAAVQENGAVYQRPSPETMVLNQDMKHDRDVFVVLRSIVEIHTDEVI